MGGTGSGWGAGVGSGVGMGGVGCGGGVGIGGDSGGETIAPRVFEFGLEEKIDAEKDFKLSL